MQISGSSVSLAEYYAELAKLRSQNANKSSAADFFGKADSDGDGGVSSSEFATLMSQMQPAGTTEASAPATGAVSSAEGKPPPPPPMSTEEVEEMFSTADVDGDGVLSAEEFSSLNDRLRPPGPDGTQQGAGAQDLLSLLQGSSSYGNAGGFGSDYSSGTSMLTELLKSIGSGSGGSSSGYSMYIQNVLKSAYGA